MLIYGGNHIRMITDRFVYLEDGSDGILISECIDEVVQELKKLMPLESRRIIYLDAFGQYDEIVIENGEFSNYRRLDIDDPDLIQVNALWSEYADGRLATPRPKP